MDFLNALVAFLNFMFIPAVSYGAQLALGALGVTLIYSILRFSNFAHGDTMAFGTMVTILVTWWLQSVGVTFGPLPTALLALPVGIAATAAFVLLTDRVVYRFYRRQKASSTIVVIVSLGVMFVMNGIVRLIIGVDDQTFADGGRFVISAGDFKTMTGLAEGLAIKSTQAVTVVTAFAVMAALFWFLNRTRTGKSMRGDLDHRGRPRHHRGHALRVGQVLQALHLFPASAAYFRRGHRRRSGQPLGRHRGRVRHRVL